MLDEQEKVIGPTDRPRIIIGLSNILSEHRFIYFLLAIVCLYVTIRVNGEKKQWQQSNELSGPGQSSGSGENNAETIIRHTNETWNYWTEEKWYDYGNYRMRGNGGYRWVVVLENIGRSEEPIMYGKATIEIPASGNIGRSRTTGLSDQQAIGFARIAAMTLSEHDTYVTLTLQSGEVRFIGQEVLGL